MLEAYWKLFFSDIQLTVRLCDQFVGTARTLTEALADDWFVGRRMIISWCDIFPMNAIDMSRLGDRPLAFVYGNQCRYAWREGGKLTQAVSAVSPLRYVFVGSDLRKKTGTLPNNPHLIFFLNNLTATASGNQECITSISKQDIIPPPTRSE